MATRTNLSRRSPRSKSAVIIRRLRAYHRFHRAQSPKVVSFAALLETCRRRGIFIAR
jgi:hypothetical protein